MVKRQIDGFTVESTAVQYEPGSAHYQPAALVTRADPYFAEKYVLDEYHTAELTEDEAHAIAETYVAKKLIGVTTHGLMWDRETP